MKRYARGLYVLLAIGLAAAAAWSHRKHAVVLNEEVLAFLTFALWRIAPATPDPTSPDSLVTDALLTWFYLGGIVVMAAGAYYTLRGNAIALEVTGAGTFVALALPTGVAWYSVFADATAGFAVPRSLVLRVVLAIAITGAVGAVVWLTVDHWNGIDTINKIEREYHSVRTY
jgi:hypothetical protein